MATNLLSVAGLTGSHILMGTRAGRIADLVVRHGSEDTYPEIKGLVVRLGRRLVFVPARDVEARVVARRPTLSTTRTAPATFVRRDDDVLLATDVLDRQIMDTDGVHVIRAADLYLAEISGVMRLVALDTSVRTLIRRLGPRRLRTRPAPQRAIDWSFVDAYTGDLTLCAPHATLTRMQAGDLASRVHELSGTTS